MRTRSKSLDRRLMEEPPVTLYHYTSPSGLIGIIKEKNIWATNVRYLNDFNELLEASDTASGLLSEYCSDDNNQDIMELLAEMREQVGTAASRYYVCSFSEDKDSLSQWRAYCPPSGGYALGIPSSHLSSLAKEKNWYFAKCIYSKKLARSIIGEIIRSFVDEFRATIKSKAEGEAAIYISEVASSFQVYIAKIGGIIKNKAFQKEQEWRLISPAIVESDTNINFRVGRSGVVPYYKFPLVSEANPNLTSVKNTSLKLTVGPNSQPDSEAILAAQYLFTRYLDISSGITHSEIPYRSW